MSAFPNLAARPALTAGALIALLTGLRVVLVILLPHDLGPDEAQYWRWAQQLDWGYYSKPPLIAWAIHGSTVLFGDAPWAVRLVAPIAHGLAGWFLFLLGLRMFNPAAGALAAATYLLMPGVWLSSAIMSTDALLLPAWSAALLGLWRLRERPDLSSAALLGLALGVAVLAKYAALYLLLGAALAALADAPTRRALLSPVGATALVVAVLVVAPNLAWNATHDFATVSHTSDNADWGGARFDLSHLPQFLADQLGVFGPVTMLALLVGLFAALRRNPETASRETWLLCFIAPPLVIIAVQALISRAHANWAATAYPAACVLLAAWAARKPWKLVVRGGVSLNALVGVIFAALALSPALAEHLGAGRAFTRIDGWSQNAKDLALAAAEHEASAILFDEREAFHGVDHAGRDLPLPPLRAWRRYDKPHSYAEEAGALQPGEDARVLVASLKADFRPRIRSDFALIRPVGEITTRLPGGKPRTYRLYIATGYEPVPRTPEYEAFFAPLRED